MARLPQPGGDQGNWGVILNDFLTQAHNGDGTLKNGSVTNASIADQTIQEAKLSASIQSKLNATQLTPDWASITNKPAVIASGADQAAARASIGAGTSNLALGTTASTAAAGNDSRLSDQRAPLDGSVTTNKVADGQITKAKLAPDLQSSLDKADNASGGAFRPLAASYRPLQGILSGISSSINSGENYPATFYAWNNNSGRYRYVGCQPVAFSNPDLGVNFNVGLDASVIANTIEVEFWSNATTISTIFYNFDKQDVWAVVDDARILDSRYQHADFGDSMATWTLTQSSPVWRKWRLGLPASTFRGIGINDGARMVPSSDGFQLAVIGDSYVAGRIMTQNAVAPGNAGTISSGALFGEFAQETGLDVWRAAVVGTGYVADGGHGAGGPYGSSSRMAAFSDIPQMDAVVVWSSANDKPHASSTVVAAAQQLWDNLKSARPNTPIIVVGPECTGWPDAALDNLNNALRTAANASTAVTAFVDLRGNNFMSGTGYDGSPQNDGNADVFISADASHLTHQGARYWGQHIARLLGTVTLPANKTSGSY